MYSPMNGTGPEFEIDADRHGSYTIKLDGKVVRRVTALTNYVGKPRWGSRKLEAEAIDDAKRDVDAFVAHHAAAGRAAPDAARPAAG
jgi:hypothetical protein